MPTIVYTEKRLVAGVKEGVLVIVNYMSDGTVVWVPSERNATGKAP